MYRKLALFVVAFGLAASTSAQEVYVSDVPHTWAFFETGHFGISWVRGRFKSSAKVILDRAAKTGSIDAVIDATSVDTGYEARDKQVRSENYLDVEKFPTITFKSNELKFNGDNLVGANGDLTIMGVTKPVSLNVAQFRCLQHPVNKREMCGAEANTAIKRSDWGIKRGATGIGDDVKIAIQIEAYKE
jgi:polyisoprenoid-binding protein YceI